MKKLIKIEIAIAILIIAILLALAIPKVTRETKADLEVEPEIIITHAQDVWLKTLQYCESKGKEDIKILDTNNKYSYGVLQFQMETFITEGKRYRILDQGLKQEEAEKIIYDVELQEKIAHQMLLNGGEKHWWNCWNNKLKTKYPKS